MKNPGLFIDHTLLKPDATEQDIRKLCREAKTWGFASVCVNPVYVSLCGKLLKKSSVKVCSVSSFPFGSAGLLTKMFEIRDCIAHGAEEIDTVMNAGFFLGGKKSEAASETAVLASLCHAENVLLKVILETCLFTPAQIREASELMVCAGADFIKTSTGFSTGGARVEDVKIMVRAAGKKAKVKASGGIRTAEDFKEMIRAGAARIGSSSGVAIMKQLKGGK